MNYIAEINSFFNWVLFNPLQPDAQALWHALMQVNNRCAVKINNEWFWRVEFSAPNMTLLSMLTFSRPQLDRMRNALIQKGRIVYKKGKGNQSGTYKIIPFDNSYVEGYVDKFPEKVWVSIEAHNVTQIVTQSDTQYVAQNGHNALHNSDTNPDLCNIFSTLINSNNIKNNNINNNLFYGDDVSRAREENQQGQLSEFLSEINCYFGITEEIKAEAQQFTAELFSKYLTRPPCEEDIIKVFQAVRHSEKNQSGGWSMRLDKDKRDILEYAFRQASAAGCGTWSYINGVLDNIRDRGLKTLNDCEQYDFERDVEKGKI